MKRAETKIGFISSGGGHLYQLYAVKSWWSNYDRFWVTFDQEDVRSILSKEKIYYAHYPESRNIVNAIRNFFLAFKILLHEKPAVLISCGAGIAPPFFYAGKLLNIKLIFIEPYDFIQFPSLSAKLIEPIADVLLVQHKWQLHFFRKAIYKGSIL